MSTIEITRVDDLREGDYVTLRWEKSEGGTVTLEGSMQFRATVGGYVITDARFVSATREVPEHEPDDVEALRAELAKAIQERDFWHQQYDDREEVTRTMRHGRRAQRERAEAAERERDEMQGDLQTQIQITRDVRAERDKALAEVERLEAEVKRLRDSMDTNTNFLISSNGTIWHHDTHCPHRRTMPTRKQIADALWPDAPESARAGMTELGILDRIVELFEQGGGRS